MMRRDTLLALKRVARKYGYQTQPQQVMTLISSHLEALDEIDFLRAELARWRASGITRADVMAAREAQTELKAEVLALHAEHCITVGCEVCGCTERQHFDRLRCDFDCGKCRED